MSRHTSLRDDGAKPKAWNLVNTEFGPVLDVKVTNFLELYEIEIKIDTMQNDGIVSWIYRQVY